MGKYTSETHTGNIANQSLQTMKTLHPKPRINSGNTLVHQSVTEQENLHQGSMAGCWSHELTTRPIFKTDNRTSDIPPPYEAPHSTMDEIVIDRHGIVTLSTQLKEHKACGPDLLP